MSRYASAEQWARFLAPLSAAVSGNIGKSDVLARAAACADALAIFPEWLTETRRRDAMATFKFWPSVAEIGDLFAGDKRHAMEMRALAQPSNLLPKPAERGPRSMEEILHVKRVVEEFKRDMATADTATRPEVKPAHLRPDQLAAARAQLAAKRAAQ
jgi:hypothetical protein